MSDFVCFFFTFGMKSDSRFNTITILFNFSFSVSPSLYPFSLSIRPSFCCFIEFRFMFTVTAIAQAFNHPLIWTIYFDYSTANQSKHRIILI